MPALVIDDKGVPAVAEFAELLGQLLDEAAVAKPTATIEPAVEKSDFEDLPGRVSQFFVSRGYKADVEAETTAKAGKRVRQNAIVETVARNAFHSLVETLDIDKPEFVQVWNLFDVLAILTDSEECDPNLLLWAVEELLDSQTIDGCRKVFDYLESRRERITAKDFKNKKLVTLRMCNELLRRLSRAEDTAFCGRVFIFLFQVFPLGDKSSVNLRGEYHVENVTSFDEFPLPNGEDADKMEVDSSGNGTKETNGTKSSESKDFQLLNSDALYPLFWSMQHNFSQPKTLFEPSQFTKFKESLEATLASFKKMQKEQVSRPRQDVEKGDRGIKRKRDETASNVAYAYNPKYLTNRDLFQLEISDLTFRRHFLVQALIILEFLLSLSASEKEKLATASAVNKSVLYPDNTLSEDDAKWASRMSTDISEHIKGENGDRDGAYYQRMVETVLTREKNWVRWKTESCPPIELPAITAEEFRAAEDAARKMATNKRLRPVPQGSLSLNFMEESAEAQMDKLKAPERYELPELDTYKKLLAEADFDIDMAADQRAKSAAQEQKASLTWRALRIARMSRFAVFEKIEDDNKIDVIFEDPSAAAAAEASKPASADDEDMGDPENLPEDARPVILSAPDGVDTAPVVALLMERSPGVFGIAKQHTTRLAESHKPEERLQYVDAKEFDVMLDGDRFVTHCELDGSKYGIASSAVTSVSEAHKVPLLLVNSEAAQLAKDNGFDSRFIFLNPADAAALYGDVASLFTKVIALPEDGTEAAAKSLEAYVYGMEEEAATVPAAEASEVKMEDAQGDRSVDEKNEDVQEPPPVEDDAKPTPADEEIKVSEDAPAEGNNVGDVAMADADGKTDVEGTSTANS